MEFQLKQTSLHNCECSIAEHQQEPLQPIHKKAFIREYIYNDARTVNDPMKIPAYQRQGNADEWYQHGFNHRVENGRITRSFIRVANFVKFDTLEELVDFIREVGEVVMTDESIEIYDDYRE